MGSRRKPSLARSPHKSATTTCGWLAATCPGRLPPKPREKSTGAGEEVMGAAAGAIANAVFDATGVRFRQFPLTPVRVKAALPA